MDTQRARRRPSGPRLVGEGGEGSGDLARVATPVRRAPWGAEGLRGDRAAPRGPVGRAAVMAAPPGMPPRRVLEEALGIDLSPTGDAAEAVAAEGAYYLERILLVTVGPAQWLPLGRLWTAPPDAVSMGTPWRSPCHPIVS